MNVLLSPQPPHFPHPYEAARLSPQRSRSPYANMSSRKRKADDHEADEMSVSPQSSPAISSRQLSRPSKKIRAAEVTGRPLSLSRLLETLDATQLRNALQTVCERHPTIGHEVVNSAPRPSVASTLEVLKNYLQRVQAAIPYGQTSSDYTYYRVKQPLVALVDAILDFTPQYLPPIETQTTASLQYLDGATEIIHELPNWDSQAHRQHKDSAYEELSRAWALVITEASKKGGGFVLHTGGWDQTLAKHNQLSGGRLTAAMQAMASNVGWIGSNLTSTQPGTGPSGDSNSILNQIITGTYGNPVRVGPW